MKSKRPTIRDVAKTAQVAPTTVSRVLNNKGYISDETRQRVEEAIATLNYIPNSLSQSLRYQKTDTIALVVSDITNPFWTTVTRGVEDVCQEHDLHVILCNTDEKQAKLSNYVNMLLKRQTDGFLLVPTGKESDVIVNTILQKQVPLVVLDRVIDGIDVDTVRSASEEGAYLLTRHLLELGHQHIALLTGSVAIYTSVERVTGYQRALQEAGLPVDERLILYGNFTQQGGYDMTHTMLTLDPPHPTALVAANNFIAMGMLRALSEARVRVPEEMSITSIDDIPFNIDPDPFLTVVAQQPYEMGCKAAELLIEQIKEKPRKTTEIILPVQFVVRRSTAQR